MSTTNPESSSSLDTLPSREGGLTIVFILMPERSAFNASFKLAKGLCARGYRIVYGGPQNFQDYVVAQGMPYHVIKSKAVVKCEEKQHKVWYRRLVPWWWQARKSAREFEIQSLEFHRQCAEILRQEAASLVLLDPLIWTFALPPLTLGIPIVTFNTSLASSFNIDLPPAFSNLLPNMKLSWATPFANFAAWSYFILKVWYRGVFQAHIRSLMLARPMQSMSSLIKKNGCMLQWSEYGPRLDTHELVACPLEFDFPRPTKEKNRTYIGACVDLSRDDGHFDWDEIDPHKPLIYCSLGTYSHAYRHSRHLFKTAINAVSKSGYWQAIIQIGTTEEPSIFGMIPPGIKIVKTAPQLKILAHANVFITHGGLSSVREAIFFGVPMVVFPGWNEQPGNAARIVYHGLGLRGTMAKIDEDTLFSMIEQVQQPPFRQSISWMQSRFRAQEDCQLGVDFVEAFLGGAQPRPCLGSQLS